MIVDECDFISIFKSYLAANATSNKQDNVDGTLKGIYKGIRQLNSLKENRNVIGGMLISSVEIPDEWKDFIIPNSIRIEPGNIDFPDYLIRESENPDEFDYSEWIECCGHWRRYFRDQWVSGNRTPLSDLKINVSFENVRERLAFRFDKVVKGADGKDEKKSALKSRHIKGTNYYIPLEVLSNLKNVVDTSFEDYIFTDEMVRAYVLKYKDE